MEVLRAQAQVKTYLFKPVYIKELQEQCGKVKELKIKDSSIIYNRLHCTTPDYIS